MQERTLREWFKGTGVHSIRFIEIPNSWNDESKWTGLPTGQTLGIADVEKWLDIGFNSGFGSRDCPTLYAWSDTEVFYIYEYDGSTSLQSCPRNPVP